MLIFLQSYYTFIKYASGRRRQIRPLHQDKGVGSIAGITILAHYKQRAQPLPARPLRVSVCM